MDSKTYVNQSTYIKGDTVKQWGANALVTILDEGKEVIFKDAKKGDQAKLQIQVKHVNTNTTYSWTLSYKAIDDLARELETYDTKKWVGAVVKLLIVNLGQGKETVGATLITRP